MLVSAKGMLTKIKFKFAPENTSVCDGYEISGQLIPNTSGNREGVFTKFDCLTRSLLLAERFEA